MSLHTSTTQTSAIESESLMNSVKMGQMEKDYSLLLTSYKLQFVESGYYWQVGPSKAKPGWAIHLSVIHCQLYHLLEVIIPVLSKNPIPFKIIRDKVTAKSMINGSLGYGQVGKMVCIYPPSDNDATQWAKRLIALTQEFRGPTVPTDCHLGAIVYTSYSTINKVSDNNTSIAFKLPKNITWPYSEITGPKVEKTGKILNHSYYILKILKPDVKGGVYLALYLKKPWQLKTCLVKEGRFNMFADDYGRDMRSRLQWQYKLYQALNKDTPLPKIFDYFETGGNSYLVMEYVKGTSITQWIQLMYQSHTWIDLPINLKIAALNLFIQVIDIVKCMHEKGFVHRDLNDNNFIINPQGKVFPIDLELVWDARENYPNPPYPLGTPGFMSPEQERKATPTVNDDIYALGGLLVLITTSLFPTLFNYVSPEKIVEQLFFFTQDDEISNLISNCRQLDPAKRPSLSKIMATIENVRNKLQKSPIQDQRELFPLSPRHRESFNSIIQAGLNGINHQKMLGKNNCWISLTHQKENIIGNEQTGRNSYVGWHTGIAGPLWLLARAKQVNYTVEDSYETYRHNWAFIEHNLSDTCKNDPSLYSGAAGVALALVEGLNSSLVAMKKETTIQIQDCLQNIASGQGLSNGPAGQIIALLRCEDFLNKEFVDKKLTSYINTILNSQMANGAWNCQTESGIKGDIFISLDKGVAGIVWALLEVLQFHHTSELEVAVQKGLKWIITQANPRKDFYNWSISTKNIKTDLWSMSYGIPGILLVLIKAYEYLKLDQYKVITESVLTIMPARPVLWNLSLASGFAGLGELYLEAFRVFKNPAWFENATWIALALKNLFCEVRHSVGMWTTGVTGYSTADLFTGNSGILHFLIRYLNPHALPHPLCASKIKSCVHIHSVSMAMDTKSGKVENL